MIEVQIQALQAELERLLREGKDEEQIVLQDGTKRLAELEFKRQQTDGQPRPLGLAIGRIDMPPTFFDPLPEELLDAFEGKNA